MNFLKNIITNTAANYFVLALFLCSILSAKSDDKLKFEIIYTASINNIPQNARNMKIWVPYPKSDNHQEIYSVKVSSPYPTYIYEEPEYGNNFLYMEVESPDLENIEIEMKILSSRTMEIHDNDFSKVGELDEDMVKEFDKYFVNTLDPVTQGTIREIVKKHISPKPTYFEKVRAIYDYVFENMDYQKDVPGYGTGDVSRACNVQSGNCIDFHSLFVAIAKESGVVATEVANIDLPIEEGAANYCNASYHCNVEVYLPNYGWFPIDISHAKKGIGSKEFYFGSLDNLRLKLGRGRNINLAPIQNGARVERLLHSPYVTINGKIHPEVEVHVLAITYDRDNVMNRRPHLIASGESAETFNWIDLNGNPFNLQEYLGKKPIVINFFSSWCGRCRWETQALNDAFLKYKDVMFIRINLMEKHAKIKEFVAKQKILHTVLPDEKGELARHFGIKYVPTNIIIDEFGKVIFSGGLLDESDLSRHLDELVRTSVRKSS